MLALWFLVGITLSTEPLDTQLGPRRQQLPPLPPEAIGDAPAPAPKPTSDGATGFALRLQPAAKLALRVLEALGARVQGIAVTGGRDVTPAEVEDLRAELAKTELLDPTTPTPRGEIRLERKSSDSMWARVTGPSGEVLWEDMVRWPAPAPQAPPGASSPTQQRVRTYFRRALSVRDTARTAFLSPAQDRTAAPGHLINPALGEQNADVAGPLRSVDAQWHLYAGDERVSEAEFARMLGDSDLVAAVERSRFNNVLTWTLSLAGGSAACLGAGVPLVAADIGPPSARGDIQVAGISLIIVGAALAAVATAYPLLPQRHYYQTRHQAELRAAEYNRRLMLELDLTPAQLRKHRAEGAVQLQP